jgi:hypothetical protein
MHSRLPPGALNGWNGWAHNVEAGEFAKDLSGNVRRIGMARLCSHLKHDFTWSAACSAVLEGFARAGKRQHLG